MADHWFVRVRPNGEVYYVFCDDMEPVKEGDIPLDPTWYYGRAPGIRISDPIHGNRYTVKNGRLVPHYDNSKDMEHARTKKEEWIDAYEGSPIMSPGKKKRFPEADYEAYMHLQEAINENEVEHTRKKGY